MLVAGVDDGDYTIIAQKFNEEGERDSLRSRGI